MSSQGASQRFVQFEEVVVQKRDMPNHRPIEACLTCLVPLGVPVDKTLTMSLLGEAVGTQSCTEVAGPGSLILK